jgi:crotonobetaine/carnitine-CoA ligase
MPAPDTENDGATTVLGQLRDVAASEPGRLFVRVGSAEYTYAEALRKFETVARGLQALSVGPGDRVAVLSANRIESVDLFFGLAALNAINVPLNVYLKGTFLEYPLVDCSASTLIVDRQGFESVLPILADLPDLRRIVTLDVVDVPESVKLDVIAYGAVQELGASSTESLAVAGPDEIAAIMYTSGTTGMPKGCVLEHGYFASVGRGNAGMWSVVADDHLLTMLPLFHMGAFCTAILPALMCRASAEALVVFSASSFMSDVAGAKATVVLGVGPAALAVLTTPDSAEDTSHRLRLASFAPMPSAAQLRFEERFGVPVLAEGYGQTECVPISISPLAPDRNRNSIGKPVDWLDVRVVDDDDNEVPVGTVGEIVLRPRRRYAMFVGYWGKPADTLHTWRNLWHHTGDFGRLDADGLLHFADRKQDSMRRRGENVSSVELELAIQRHPSVAEACAHAVPSELGEDDIKVCLVLAPDSSLDLDDLFTFFERELPYFAVPRYLEVLPALPRNPLGKIMKHELRGRGVTPDTVDLAAQGLVVSRERRRGVSAG